jgi:hypothetical protein
MVVIGKARAISLEDVGVNFDVAFLLLRHLTTMLEISCHGSYIFQSLPKFISPLSFECFFFVLIAPADVHQNLVFILIYLRVDCMKIVSKMLHIQKNETRL